MRNFTVGQKIGAGFSALILLAAILGGVAVFAMLNVRHAAEQMSTEFVPEARLGVALTEAVARTQLAARSYGFTAEEKYAAELRTGIAELEKELIAARALAAAHPHLLKLRAHLTDLDAALKDYKAAVQATQDRNHTLTAGREKLNMAAADFVAGMDKIVSTQNEALAREIAASVGPEKLLERQRKLALVTEISLGGNLARIAVFKAQALRNPQLISEALEHFTGITTRFGQLRGLLKVPADLAELDRSQTAARLYQEEMKEVMGILNALDEIGRTRAAAGARLDRLADEISDAGMERTVTAADASTVQLARASLTTQLVLAGAITLGVTIAFLLARAISRVLRATIDSLSAGSAQIAAAAHEVSGSAQSLAGGASQQAAALEETSAALEEMSSMTKRNADSAGEARTVAQAASAHADQSAASVGRLNTAMAELKSSSSEITKIVKTIDEIAFQTNILALNAAVEAARAGDAGMGFAVVAEEVRSLAQRSATAAKETAEKIETALTRTEDSARLGLEVSGNLQGIVTEVRKLDGIVSGIAQASSEQARGIEQINTAVSEMDKVTQSNAAAAEESASAAEEMNAQTVELNTLVGTLLVMVGGSQKAGHPADPGDATPGGRGNRGDLVAPSPVAAASAEPSLT